MTLIKETAIFVPLLTHQRFTRFMVGCFTSQGDQDWSERANGRMAIRLLGCNSAGHLHPTSDATVTHGARLAIIDLRVFVPEVIPVLSICADPALGTQLDAIPFSQRLIGNGAPPPAMVTSASAAVEEAVRLSEIELLQRLSPDTRERLATEIGGLARRANLYGTQLDAMVQGLTCSLHCTQGPPGTGKVRVVPLANQCNG
jgi:hypothetical protein